MFTDPVVLQQIDRPLLREFLKHFNDDLNASNLILPTSDLSEDDFFSSFAALLNASEVLPTSMLEALCAIAELATPENQSRLETAVLNAPLGLGLDPRSPPVRLAFHLWLWRPYCTNRADTSPSPPLEERVGERRPFTVSKAEPYEPYAPAGDDESAAPKPSDGGTVAPTAPPGPKVIATPGSLPLSFAVTMATIFFAISSNGGRKISKPSTRNSRIVHILATMLSLKPPCRS